MKTTLLILAILLISCSKDDSQLKPSGSNCECEVRTDEYVQNELIFQTVTPINETDCSKDGQVITTQQTTSDGVVHTYVNTTSCF